MKINLKRYGKFALVMICLSLTTGIAARIFYGASMSRVETLLRTEQKVADAVGDVLDISVTDVKYVKERGPWEKLFLVEIRGATGLARAEVSLDGDRDDEHLVIRRITRIR